MRLVDDENRAQMNRAWWDERVPMHMPGEFDNVDGFLAGRSALRPFEIARWPFLERKDDRTYHMPADRPQAPLLYSIKAIRPRAVG